MTLWIQTYENKVLDLLGPAQSAITISDIAYALSGEYRYTNYTRLTVAQHSVLCARMAPVGYRYEALMHDAHEAAMGDISKPVKNAIKMLALEAGASWDPVAELDRRLRRAYALRFDLAEHIPAKVKEIDLRMLQTERQQLLAPPARSWKLEGVEPYRLNIQVWSPVKAQQEFMVNFVLLAPIHVLESVDL